MEDELEEQQPGEEETPPGLKDDKQQRTKARQTSSISSKFSQLTE